MKKITFVAMAAMLFTLWYIPPAFSVCKSVEVFHDQTVCICSSSVLMGPDGVEAAACSSSTSSMGASIQDSNGTIVKTFASGEQSGPGIVSWHWDGTDEGGKDAPPGTYHLVITRNGVPDIQQFYYEGKGMTITPIGKMTEEKVE